MEPRTHERTKLRAEPLNGNEPIPESYWKDTFPAYGEVAKDVSRTVQLESAQHQIEECLRAEIRALKASMTWKPLDSNNLPPKNKGLILVTNNIDAVNSRGFKSHVWLVFDVHVLRNNTVCAYDGDRMIHNLTHWRYAIPEEWQGGK